MRKQYALLAAAFMVPALAQADEATVKEVHDAPAVKGSIIANLLEKHDNPFVLYPYENNYLLYTYTSDMNKEAISSYNWADKAKKDEVKFQLSLAFPLWRGILGDNSVLAASYTQRSWWQLSNRGLHHRFVKPTMSRRFFSAGPPTIRWAAGHYATSSWV